MHSQSTSTRKAQIDEAAERLNQAFDALIADPEQFAQYLAMVGRLYHYSPTNCALIFAQCDHASMVGSYRHWQTEGRQVRKGEQSIKIFAPVSITVRDLAGQPITDEDGNPKKRTAFRLVPVFDISQTDGPELPDMPKPTRPDADLTDAQRTAWAAVIRLIERNGFTFEQYPISDCAGYCDPHSRRIAVDSRMPAAAQFKTTIHEAAHMMADHVAEHDNKSAREAIAEGVAFVVCANLNLDVSSYSPAYILRYVDSVERLRECMGRIKDLAGRILDAIHADASAESCPACGTVYAPSDRFCGECGQPRTTDPDPEPPAPVAALVEPQPFRVVGKHFTDALGAVVKHMRKTTTAKDRRQPGANVMELRTVSGSLTIAPLNCPEDVEPFAVTVETFTPATAVHAWITFDDAYALAQTLDKAKDVTIAQDTGSVTFSQPSAAKGYTDAMRFLPPAPFKTQPVAA